MFTLRSIFIILYFKINFYQMQSKQLVSNLKKKKNYVLISVSPLLPANTYCLPTINSNPVVNKTYSTSNIETLLTKFFSDLTFLIC